MMMEEKKSSDTNFSEISQMPYSTKLLEEGESKGAAAAAEGEEEEEEEEKEKEKVKEEEEEEEEAVAVAVGRKKSSIQAFEWALETLMTNKSRILHLLYVVDPLRFVQTGLGPLPFDQANEISQKEARHLQSLKIQKVTQVYKKMCEKKEVELRVHCIESDSIQKGVLDRVLKLRIKKLVVGSSSGLKMKWLKKSSISVLLAKTVPDFCAVMVVRNGRLVSFKDASYSCPSSASDRSSTTSYGKRKSKGYLTSGSESGSSNGYEQRKYKASFGSSTFTSRSGGYITDEYLESFQSNGAFSSRTLSLGKFHEENFMSQAFESLRIASQSSFPIDNNASGNILDTVESLKSPPTKRSNPKNSLLKTTDDPMHGESKIMSIGRRDGLYANTRMQGDELASYEQMVVALANARQEIHALQQDLAMARQQATENWRMYLEAMNKLKELEKKKT